MSGGGGDTEPKVGGGGARPPWPPGYATDYRPYMTVNLVSVNHWFGSMIETSVSGLTKKVAGHQGLQLQKVVGPDEKL